MPKRIDDIEGFVLTGGASSRMGRDKARLPFGEAAFFERAAAALRPLTTKPIVIVGGAGFARLSESFRFLPDNSITGVKEHERGAIIGLQTIFKNSKTSWVAILACDLPFADSNLFQRLSDLRTDEFEAIVPVQPDGRWQPLCALYRSQACLAHAEKMIEENIWSVRELVSRIRTRRVEFVEISDLPNSERFFLNVNTPADYEHALHLKAADNQ